MAEVDPVEEKCKELLKHLTPREQIVFEAAASYSNYISSFIASHIAADFYRALAKVLPEFDESLGEGLQSTDQVQHQAQKVALKELGEAVRKLGRLPKERS